MIIFLDVDAIYLQKQCEHRAPSPQYKQSYTANIMEGLKRVRLRALANTTIYESSKFSFQALLFYTKSDQRLWSD